MMSPYRSIPLSDDDKPAREPSRWPLRIGIGIGLAIVAAFFGIFVGSFGPECIVPITPSFLMYTWFIVALVRKWNDPRVAARYQAKVEVRAAKWMRSVR